MKKFILIILLLIPISVNSASPYPIPITDEDRYVQEFIDNARYWMQVLLMKAPKYDWGKEGLEGGDCSGQVHWIFRKAGAPFPRTTAFKMYHGEWPGYNMNTWDSATFPDGIFFSWKKPGDHVGLVDYKLDNPEQLNFVEASSSANRFKKTSFKKNSVYDKSFLGIRVFDLSTGYGKLKLEKIDKSKLW
jgi:hypothetical protein